MSIRIMMLTVYVAVLSVYAWRNWFVSLCGALLLMAVVEHPDMPSSLAGIQGLNPWNILMLNVLIGWFRWRQQTTPAWDLPPRITRQLLLYFLVIVVSFVRMWVDRSHLEENSSGYLLSEYLVNCVKWVLPGVLLYDGCRTEQQVRMALFAVLGIYFLLAVQVIRWMPLRYALSGSDLNERSAKIIQNEVGYHRVNMSMLLAGGSWAIFAAAVLVRTRLQKLAVLAASAATMLGQALTGGRTGYATWGLLGIILSGLRWRRLLILPPVMALVVAMFLPGVFERMTAGFGKSSGSIVTETDSYSVTSGRSIIWPYVIDKIGDSPVIGYGRLAMARTGLAQRLLLELDESFPHPHNAYLEMLLDNGIVGFLCVIPFYIIVLRRSVPLFLDRENAVNAAVGGATLALVLALLIAALGSQTFYPREGAVGMWASIGLMLRLSVGLPTADVGESTVT